VRNWNVWQSYRTDRDPPPWIKVHRRLIHDPNFVRLTDAQRGQLVSMWILAADRDGTIPADTKMLQKLCYMDSELDLEVFVAHGFLEPWRQGDVTVTPTRRQPDAPEKNRREKNSGGAASRRVAYSEAFEEVWIAGLRRGDKPKAFTEYQKAVPSKIAHSPLLAAVRAHVAAAREPQYVAHLHRWIHGERWQELSLNGSGGRPGFLQPSRRPQ